MKLEIDPQELQPIIRQITEQVLADLEARRPDLDDKLCYSEAEAADLLGVKVHVLRDERRRGRIKASKIVGGRIRYSREQLVAYLRGREE